MNMEDAESKHSARIIGTKMAQIDRSSKHHSEYKLR